MYIEKTSLQEFMYFCCIAICRMTNHKAKWCVTNWNFGNVKISCKSNGLSLIHIYDKLTVKYSIMKCVYYICLDSMVKKSKVLHF